MRRAIVLVCALVLVVMLGGTIAPAQETPNNYTWNDATNESYWYSVYNLQALLASEMGIPLSITEELVTRWAQEAGLSEEESQLVREMRDRLVAVPYASGDSSYVQSGSFQWAQEKADRTITSEAIAWMILLASSQAKQLEHLYQMGIAQTAGNRFWSMLLGYVASEAARFAQTNLRASETQLYVRAWKENVGVSDSSLRPPDQAWMLWALSELDSLANGFSFYRGTLSHTDIASWTTELFHAITSYHESHPDWLNLNPHDTGMMIEGISAYAATLGNGPDLEEAVALIQSSAQTLKEQIKKIETVSGDVSPLANLAEAVRALIIAQRMTGDSSLRQAALEGWTSMGSLWDEAAGVYRLARSQGRQAPSEYTLREIGALVGAFSAIINGAGMTDARAQYAQFFHGTIKASGLMLAEGEEAGGSTDNDEVLAPDKAGGPFGRAPVFASILQYDQSNRSWFLMNTRFNTSGALYLAARLLWIGQREAQPYLGPPRWGLPESKEAQFVSLRMQVAQLGADRTLSTEIEAIRQLLIALEGRFEELRKQESISTIVAQDLTDFKARLESLEQKVNSDLASINQKLTTLESKAATLPTTPVRGKFSLPDGIIIVLILLILALGLVSYQRVLQQPA